MTTATVTIRTTNTDATVPANRLALHPAVFARLCAESSHPAGLGAIDELHITTTTDDAAELDALDDTLRARAQTVADFAGRDCVALFSGEGIDGCDVWARCDVEEIADDVTAVSL